MRYRASCVAEPSTEVLPTIQLEDVISGSARLLAPLDTQPPAGQNRFRPGDVLFSKLRPYLAKSLLVNEPAHGSGEFLCLRPGPELDSRFLTYVTLTRPWLDHAGMASYGAKMPRTSWEQMAGFPAPDLPVREQRRIADFLDDRVARIDRIIAARREQLALVVEEAAAFLDRLVRVPTAVLRPLQSLTDPARPIQYGIVLPGPDFEGGIPIIKGGDIGSGRLAHLDLNRTDPAIESAYRRSRVYPGDYVIAIRGSVGDLDIVPDELPFANLTQDSARIAPHACHAQWLVATLRAPSVQSEIAKRVTGSTVKGINIAELRKAPIPVPGWPEQEQIGEEASRMLSQLEDQKGALNRSFHLLAEYKSSLITAAVTGEIDVATAGSGIPA